MKVSCDVIKDLLPLYVEEMVSNDTRQLVDTHIENCIDCKNELESIKNFNEIPIDTNIEPLKKIERKLLKNKIQAIVFTGLLVLVFTIIGMAYLTAPEYLPYSSSIVSLKEYDDGKILIKFSEQVDGYDINNYGDNYSITAWNSALNKYFFKNKNQNIILNPNGEKVKSIYYYNIDGSEDILIYGINPYINGGQVTLPRLVLGYYFIAAMLLTILCGFLVFIFRKKHKVRNVLEKILLLPLSYIISHIFIKGFITVSYLAQRDFYLILLLLIPIYCLLNIGINVYRKLKGKVNI